MSVRFSPEERHLLVASALVFAGLIAFACGAYAGYALVRDAYERSSSAKAHDAPGIPSSGKES